MAEEKLSQKNYTILIAEDNEVNMFFLVTLIKIYLPHAILLEAKDGEKVANILSQIRPDLIYLDLSLPLKDGFEIALELKSDEETKDIPIIVLTASDSDQLKSKLIAIGVDLYIKKPASKDIIKASLIEILKINS